MAHELIPGLHNATKKFTGMANDARELGKDARKISGAAQDIGRAVGEAQTADDKAREVNAKGETAANRAEVQRIKSQQALDQARGYDANGNPVGVPVGISGAPAGLPVQGARGAASRGPAVSVQSASDSLVGAIADAMRTQDQGQRQAKIDVIVDYVASNPQFQKQTYNTVTGQRETTFEMNRKGSTEKELNDISTPYAQPVRGQATPEQLVLNISKQLEQKVGAPAITRGELYIEQPAPVTRKPVVFHEPAAPAVAPAAAPAAPAPAAPAAPAAAAGEDQYHAFVKKAAAAVKGNVELLDAPLPVTGGPIDGKVIFPAGKYDTGQTNAKGEKVVLEFKEAKVLDPMKAQIEIENELAKNGIGKGHAKAAPAPAPEQPRVEPVVHKEPAKAAPAGAPKAHEFKLEAGSGPKAKTYDGIGELNISASQVKGLQEQLMNNPALKAEAEAMKARGGADGKPGKATMAAIDKVCKTCNPPLDPHKVNFNDPNSPEMKQFAAAATKMEKEAIAQQTAKANDPHVATDKHREQTHAAAPKPAEADKQAPPGSLRAALAAQAAQGEHSTKSLGADAPAHHAAPASQTLNAEDQAKLDHLNALKDRAVGMAIQISGLSAARGVDSKDQVAQVLNDAAKDDGKVHLPKGEVEIPNLNVKLSFNGEQLSPEDAQKMINDKVAAAGISREAAPQVVAPIAPAPATAEAPAPAPVAPAPAAPEAPAPAPVAPAAPVVANAKAMPLDEAVLTTNDVLRQPAAAAPAPAPRTAEPSILFTQLKVFGAEGVDKPAFGTVPSVQQMAEAVAKAPAANDEPLAPTKVPDARDPVLVAAARAGNARA